MLPFEVLGDAAEDRWLADGLADDLIAALSAWVVAPVVSDDEAVPRDGITASAEHAVPRAIPWTIARRAAGAAA